MTFIKRFQISLMALVFLGCSHTPNPETTQPAPVSPPSVAPIKAPMQKSIGEHLKLEINSLVSFSTGSDAGGCDWNSKTNYSKAADRKMNEARKKLIDDLLKMPVWEMSSNDKPKGCSKAYDADSTTNGFTFQGGYLSIPPSGLYPPSSNPNVDVDYFDVAWNVDPKSTTPKRFCLKRLSLLAVLAQHAEASLDCEF